MAARLTTQRARATFAEVIGRARFAGERTLITVRGRPAAVVVPVADLDRLESQASPSQKERQ